MKLTKLYKNILATFIVATSLLAISSVSRADGLNAPGGNIRVCRVSVLQDNNGVAGSLRRALDQGYNLSSPLLPGLCADSIQFGISGIIRLSNPINLTNAAYSNFVFEKDPSVQGEVIIDASGLPENTCAITVSSNRTTLRGFTIQGNRGPAICIESGSTGNTLTNLTVRNNRTAGIWIKSGSQGNNINNNFIYDNAGVGVQLDDATQNRTTQNALYRNTLGAISSMATHLAVTINSAAPVNSEATSFAISGSVASTVAEIELYRGVPQTGSTTNFIATQNNITALNFLATIPARSGEDIFAIAIGTDGSTGPSTAFTRLSTVSVGSGGGTGKNPGMRSCFPGQVFAPNADFDHDGIYDVNEDKNANCLVDPDETDPTNPDTDGDGIPDGVEDRNHNGLIDKNESNPRLQDTDGDRIPDNLEDANHDGIHQVNELDPTKADTDSDGIPDQYEDINRNGQQDMGETDATLADTDRDGLDDGEEDVNHNGVVDLLESDPRIYDTDSDGLPDGTDPCPKNPSRVCSTPCIPGQIPPSTLDTDGDGIPDVQEDINSNCVRDSFETDVYNRDTDGDGRLDSADTCPLSTETTCISTCTPGAFVPSNRDSDSDGVPDVEEDPNGNCAVDPGESNPFSADTDMDGIRDNIDLCPLDRNPLCAAECIPGVTPPEDQDSDGDSLTDREEDLNRNCVQDGAETNFRNRDSDNDGLFDNLDPCATNPDLTCESACIPGAPVAARRDSDRDGIPDVLEDRDNNCVRAITETDAFNNDTDGDGILDGIEDRNLNGTVDTGETNPRLTDSDQDGIADGLEDKNRNGTVDFGEMNPASQDSDGDGVPDRIEDTNLNGIYDRGETNGALADTDQDGLSDGDEDKNHNGRVDAGETDPRNPDTDGDGASDGQEVNNGTNAINASNSDFNRARGKSNCALDVSAPYSLNAALTLLFGMGVLVTVRRKQQ